MNVALDESVVSIEGECDARRRREIDIDCDKLREFDLESPSENDIERVIEIEVECVMNVDKDNVVLVV